jgi:hypothetical protein
MGHNSVNMVAAKILLQHSHDFAVILLQHCREFAAT